VKWGVVCFPGSNDERDTIYALTSMGFDAVSLWHGEADLKGVDAIVLPGGFSYGDYLRPGAIARFSPLMGVVATYAERGGPLLGICNGFQILCEAGLLPGALVRNSGLKFTCDVVELNVCSAGSAFTAAASPGDLLRIPQKNGEGCYVADEATLDELETNGRVLFRYANGAPNGAARDIAGITNEKGNIVGLMPHPEHAVDPALGLTDGQVLFQSAAIWLQDTARGVQV
jgi:phosphoribosylformylglycinamidine synthase I